MRSQLNLVVKCDFTKKSFQVDAYAMTLSTNHIEPEEILASQRVSSLHQPKNPSDLVLLIRIRINVDFNVITWPVNGTQRHPTSPFHDQL